MSTENRCMGILGRLFGHKYVTYETECDLPDVEEADWSHLRELNAMKSREKQIICKRCGDEKPDREEDQDDEAGAKFGGEFKRSAETERNTGDLDEQR